MRINRQKLIPLLILIICEIAGLLSYGKYISDTKRDLVHELYIMKSNVEEVLTHTSDRAMGVATFIGYNYYETIDELELQKVIDELLGENKFISNVGIFKDTTAIFTYPYESNMEMIKVNLIDIPSQKKDALRVKLENISIITPPVPLVQGGVGIMTRVPINTSNGEYWGQLGYMIEFDEIIDYIGIENNEFLYSIDYSDGIDLPENIYSTLKQNYLYETIEVELPSAKWIITADTHRPWAYLPGWTWFLVILGFFTYRISMNYALQIEVKNKLLNEMSYKDELTGLKNRRSIRFEGKRFNAAILFDVDDFKKINDEYGHHVGDEVLVILAKRANLVVRESDFLIRWGGEEFVVLMESENIQTVIQISDRIKKSIDAVFCTNGNEINVNCSFGIAYSEINENSNIHNLIKLADEAMYEAKANGKNQIITKKFKV